jgi:hypothetical protein
MCFAYGLSLLTLAAIMTLMNIFPNIYVSSIIGNDEWSMLPHITFNVYVCMCLVQVQGQYQVIPAYYDQTGSIMMGNVRGIGNGTPMRLVSPAPVIVNATGTPSSNMRLLGNQPQQIATPPASIYNSNQQPSLYTSTASNGTTISGKSPIFTACVFIMLQMSLW